jgi:endonuclease/exonuclease/phosphatase (EEP) superfamily protein YafD
VFKRNRKDVTDLEAQDVDASTSKKKKRLHRQWGGAVLGLLAAIAGLAVGRLGYLYPVFDVVSQFGMQFSLMATAFVIAAILPRYKAILGFSLTAAFIAAYGAWPHIVSDGRPEGPFPIEAGEQQFTVAHFNIHAENTNISAVTAEIKRLDADLVTLVEFESEKQPILDALASQYPYRHAFFKDDPYANVAILSKLPVLEQTQKGAWAGAPYGAVKLGGRLDGIWFYAIHTTRFPYSRAQLRQTQELVKELQRVSGPKLLMGDFNTTPFSRLPGIIESGLGVRRVTHLPTWPAQLGLPQLAIDHIFLSNELRVIAEQQIGNAAGSDHYPITMTLAFKPK